MSLFVYLWRCSAVSIDFQQRNFPSRRTGESPLSSTVSKDSFAQPASRWRGAARPGQKQPHPQRAWLRGGTAADSAGLIGKSRTLPSQGVDWPGTASVGLAGTMQDSAFHWTHGTPLTAAIVWDATHHREGGRSTRAEPKNATDLEAVPSNNLLGLDLSKFKLEHFEGWLLIMCVVAVLGAMVFEMCMYRFAAVDLSQEISYGNETHENQLSRIFVGVWPLIKPYLWHEGSWCPCLYVLVLAVLGIWNLCIGFMFTIWGKEFWDAMENKHLERFIALMQTYTVLLVTAILVGTYEQYIGMMFVIDWRRWMTRWFLGLWLEAKAYYQMQLSQESNAPDNPDQRIQEDINLFVPALLMLATGFANAVGELAINLPLLLFLSPTTAFGVFYCPGWLLYFAIIYSTVGTFAAHYIGNKLILVNFAKQRYEADFRYHIVQVRDHAESIALFASEECELRRMEGRFDAIVRVWWALMLYTKRLGFFTSFYANTASQFSWLILAPSYFRGDVSLGSLFMLIGALLRVKASFDWIISSYTTLTDFRATADRLENFHKEMARHKTVSDVNRLQHPAPHEPDAAVVAQDICVRLPASAGGRAIWQGAGLTVRRGEFVLLTAPEGSGKSCFFRALAGIWPDSSGTVYLPGDGALFVPQHSHIPQGTLKQALTYPECEDNFSDVEVRQALSAVALDKALAGRNLSEEANWEMALSGGERQRLAIAHAVLRRPEVLFLDEATSAMGNDGALELYELLRKPGTLPDGAAVVSISHSISLLQPVHDRTYAYDGASGKWKKSA